MINLICGDALEKLKTLPDGCVQTCVTSPPYYGLRDYGTAKWEGGDPGCDHNPQKPDGGDRSDRTLPLGRGGIYKDICAKCGAIRIDNQIGLEESPEAYIAKLVAVFREVKRVLKDDGTLWVNMGDSYARNPARGIKFEGTNTDFVNRQAVEGNRGLPVPEGCKEKDLIGIPWMLAFALRADGWWLRSEIIWNKPNPMPESVTDRPTKSHEQIFLLAKSARYYYDAEAIREPINPNNSGIIGGVRARTASGALGGENKQHEEHREYDVIKGANKRSVWTITTKPYKEAHFATFPPDLIEPCILAGTSEKGECPKCGKAWKRILEKPEEKEKDWDAVKPNERGIKGGAYGWQPDPHRKERINPIETKHSETIGWQPQCDCGLDPIPQTVLDPFNGSGTTGEVCIYHRRDYIGIELNPEYIKLTKKRLNEKPILLPQMQETIK